MRKDLSGSSFDLILRGQICVYRVKLAAVLCCGVIKLRVYLRILAAQQRGHFCAFLAATFEDRPADPAAATADYRSLALEQCHLSDFHLIFL